MFIIPSHKWDGNEFTAINADALFLPDGGENVEERRRCYRSVANNHKPVCVPSVRYIAKCRTDGTVINFNCFFLPTFNPAGVQILNFTSCLTSPPTTTKPLIN